MVAEKMRTINQFMGEMAFISKGHGAGLAMQFSDGLLSKPAAAVS